MTTDMDDLEPPPEAKVIPLGEPIEGGEVMFAGSLVDTRAFIRAMSAAERDAVSIWTPGHVFAAGELLAEAPGHEHDPMG